MVKGLRCYLSVFGDTMVPQGFVVPDGEAWPQECRGQRLGEAEGLSFFFFVCVCYIFCVFRVDAADSLMGAFVHLFSVHLFLSSCPFVKCC